MRKLNMRIGVLPAAVLVAGLLAAAPGVAVAAAAPEGAQAPQEHAAAEAEGTAAAHGGAEHATDDHGGGEGGLFSGDLGNAIWTLGIFLIVLFVLGKFAWGPLLSGLQSREKFIREALDDAKQEREEAQRKLAEYEARLAEARGEVDAIMDEARRDADVVRQREEERARQEYDQMIGRAKREIEIAQETAVKDLYSRAAQLATAAATAVLEREIRPEDHERLIADSIAALDRSRGAQSASGKTEA